MARALAALSAWGADGIGPSSSSRARARERTGLEARLRRGLRYFRKVQLTTLRLLTMRPALDEEKRSTAKWFVVCLVERGGMN